MTRSFTGPYDFASEYDDFIIPEDFDYWYIDTEEEMEELAVYLKEERVDLLSFDVETIKNDDYVVENYKGKKKKVGKDMCPHRHPSASIICASLAWRNSCGEVEGALIDGAISSEAIEAMELVMNTPIAKLAQNATYDIIWLGNYDVKVSGPVYDTMGMDFYFDEEGRKNRHGLEVMMGDHFGLKKKTFKQTFTLPPEPGRKTGKLQTLDDVYFEDQDKLFKYSLSDPIATLFLFEFLKEKLERIPWTEELSYMDLFDMLEPDLVTAGLQMETNGMLPDLAVLDEKGDMINEAYENALDSFLEWAGCDVNPNSPVQMYALFFGRAGHITEISAKKIPVIGRGWPILTKDQAPTKCFSDKTGKLSTGVDTMEIYKQLDLLDEHEKEGIDHFLNVKKYDKAQSNYGWGLISYVNPETNRAHPNIRRFAAVTHRYAAKKPALLTIPNPGKDPFKLREVWVASPGYKLIVGDEDQFEIKIMAEASGDYQFKKDVTEGLDLHGLQALNLAKHGRFPHIDIDDYPRSVEGLKKFKEDFPKERGDGKTANFATMYGQSPFTLARDANMTVEEAKETQAAVFSMYPSLNDLFEYVREHVVQYGHIRNIFNVIRRLPNGLLEPPSRYDRSPEAKKLWSKIRGAQREAVNYMAQSSAAFIIKCCLVTIVQDEYLASIGYRLLLQVHDEIVGEAPEQYAEQAAERIAHILENPFEMFPELDQFALDVPLTADVKICDNWAQAK